MWVTTLGGDRGAHRATLAPAPRRLTRIEMTGGPDAPVLADGVPIGAPTTTLTNGNDHDQQCHLGVRARAPQGPAQRQKVQLTFSDAEFERRLAGLRRIMAEKDLDAVVLTSYHAIKYYSDFLFTYFGRSYAMVVTTDDPSP